MASGQLHALAAPPPPHPRPNLTRGKVLVAVEQEAGWTPELFLVALEKK
jgi:hypothetical protein